MSSGQKRDTVFNYITFRSSSDPAIVAAVLIKSEEIHGNFEALLTITNPSAKKTMIGTF